MARWKAHVDFLLSVTELLFLSLTTEALQGKTCQSSLLSGEGGSLWAKISGGRGRPWGILFGFYKTRHILLSDSANCTVLCAVVLTEYRRVTDKRTDKRMELLQLVQRLQCEHCGALKKALVYPNEPNRHLDNAHSPEKTSKTVHGCVLLLTHSM